MQRLHRWARFLGLVAIVLAACSRSPVPEGPFATLTLTVPAGTATLDARIAFDPEAYEYVGAGSPHHDVWATARRSGEHVTLSAFALEPMEGAMAYVVFRARGAGDDAAEPRIVSARAVASDGAERPGVRSSLGRGAVNPALSYDEAGARELLAAHAAETDLDPSFADVPLGDVNGSGGVTAGDALQILQFATDGSLTPDPFQAYAANMNGDVDAGGDAVLTSGDALAALKKAVDSSLPAALVVRPANLSIHEGESGLLLVGNAGNVALDLTVDAPTGVTLSLLGGIAGQTAAYSVAVAAGADSGDVTVASPGLATVSIPLVVVPGDEPEPTVAITSPADGDTFTDASITSFTATASDPQGGDIAGGVSWSSDLDGPLGTGASILADLSQGTHVITASVTHDDVTVTDSVTITVTGDGAPVGGTFQHQVVASLLAQPMSMEFLPDGRLVILQKAGRSIIGDPSTVPMSHSSFLHLSDIDHGGERGMIDLAIDPDFETNGYFYLYYSPASSGNFRISRFTDTGDVVSRTATEMILWEDTGGYDSCCHYGAGLDIGPDGKLWLTTGDQFYGLQDPGAVSPAVDLSEPAGKVIRINTDGTIPDGSDGWPANPFLDDPDALDEIWAYGLRNPFRASWDLPSERFFIGEVGGDMNTVAWEDLHIAKAESAYAGLNYGWPHCEGLPPYRDFPDCPLAGDDLATPLYAYEHGGGGASITGGFVYRGSTFPDGYEGAYFYADYVREWIRYLTFDDEGNVIGDFEFAPDVGLIVALEEGTDGALYYADVTGTVGRYVHDEGNQAPEITAASADPTLGAEPLTVTFGGSATDADGDALTYEWDFGDGASSSGAVPASGVLPEVQHEYTDSGNYNAFLHVSDGFHVTSSVEVNVQVGTPPVAVIDEPADGTLFRAGDVVAFSAPPPASGESYEWTVEFIHNEHTHPVLDDYQAESGTVEIPSAGHSYADDTGYRITLEVTGDFGLTDTTSVEIYPDKVDLTLDTDPSGLSTIVVDTVPRTTPAVLDTLIGFQHTVSVSTSVCADGTLYEFANWSDGGAAEHVITVPETDASLTATFTATGVCTDSPE